MSDSDHEERDEKSEWRGPCRPEHFDAEAATKAMQKPETKFAHLRKKIDKARIVTIISRKKR